MRVGRKTLKNILIAIIVLVVLAVAAIIVMAFMNNKASKAADVIEGSIDMELLQYGDVDKGIHPVADQQLADYRNILIMGIDTETKNNAEGNRSDAIVIVSISENSEDVRMFSIYRDTYLEINDKYGLDKINHAHAFGGMDLSMYAINRNLDLNIRECITLTWDVVRTLVDDLGGIPIDILQSEMDYMNKSLPEENKIKGTGTQILDGDQAVLYSRIRKDSPDGDHRRNERFKDVLAAAFNKAQECGTREKIEITEKIMKMIDTNMPNSEVTEMMEQMTSYEIMSSTEWPYDTKGTMIDGIYYGVPQTLESNVAELHEEVYGQEDYVPTETVTGISEKIENR